MKTDILVIGGGPAGVISGVLAKKHYPRKKVVLARVEEKAFIPCGLPYVFRRLKSLDEDLMGDQGLEQAGIKLIIDRATEITRKNKEIKLKNGKTIEYEKLILATGWVTKEIPIPGLDLIPVWQIKKDYSYLSQMRRAMNRAKKVVIIGGGFIGMEIAEELAGFKNKKISVVEMLDHCLAVNFDQRFSQRAEEQLNKKGVKFYTGAKVEKIEKKNNKKYVVFSSGKKLEADEIVLSIGSQPNIELAEQAGIKIAGRVIKVNSYMQTSDQDIFAVGDCAQTRDFVTKKNSPIMLASVACMEARIAAINLYSKKKVANPGTVGAFMTYMDGLALGAAGMIEKRAQAEGIKVVVGQAEAPNCHPGKFPSAKPIKVKLIFNKKDQILIGGEVAGPPSAAELVNVISLAIQQKMTARQIVLSQVATHPLLTPAPTVYPLIKASLGVMGK